MCTQLHLAVGFAFLDAGQHHAPGHLPWLDYDLLKETLD